MSVKPHVSVVLPVYNGAKYISDAIRSVAAQTHGGWELLILDDGSQDQSAEICREHAAEDGRVRFFENPRNLGLGRTMNRLVELARGDYIAVQEQDDVSVPDRLESEVAALETNPDAACVSGIAAWMDDSGNVFHYYPTLLIKKNRYPAAPAEMVRYLYLNKCKVVNAGCMFRRSAADALQGPFDEAARLSVDWQFFLRLAHRHRIIGIPKVVVHMRRGANHSSLSANHALAFREARRCIQVIYSDYRRDPDSPVDRGLYLQAMSRQLCWEARVLGAWPGLFRILLALLYDPLNGSARAMLAKLCRAGLSKPFRTLMEAR